MSLKYRDMGHNALDLEARNGIQVRQNAKQIQTVRNTYKKPQQNNELTLVYYSDNSSRQLIQAAISFEVSVR